MNESPLLRRPTTWVAFTLILFGVIIVLIFVPKWLYPNLTSKQLDAANLHGIGRLTARTDRLKIQSDTRTSLLQFLGALLVLSGAFVAWKQYRTTVIELTRKSEAEQASRHLEQYSKAMEQMGSSDPNVRMGAVFSLTGLAESSIQYRTAVGEVLAAFIRNQSPWPPPLATQAIPSSRPKDGPIEDLVDSLRTYASDVQAAISELGRHTYKWYGSERFRFRRVDLRRSTLAGLHFERAAFTESHLERAWAPSGHFAGASFRGAILAEATLTGADLSGANLRGTVFTRAIGLATTDLQAAIFDSTTRWPADFSPKDAVAAGAIEVAVASPPSRGQAVVTAI